MGGHAFLAGFGEVVRQQQQTLGTQALGFLRHLDGQAGRTTDAGENRHRAGAGVDGGLDDLAVLARLQREELAGATGSEQRRGTVGAEPFQALDVAGAIEVALRVEVGDRE